MNKVTTAALAGLLAVTAGAQASASRVNGFGASAAFIADVQDIFSLPGTIAGHADTTYIELGAPAAAFALPGNSGNNLSVANNAWGGVHTKLAGGVLGVWFNRVTNGLGSIDAGYSAPDGGLLSVATVASIGTAVKAPLHNQIDLLYGFGLSDSTTLGVEISRATNSTRTETVTTSTSSTETNVGDLGLGLGLEQKGVGPIDLLEVGLTLNMRGDSYVNKAANTNKVNANGLGIGLRVGGDLSGKDGMFGRFELGLTSQSLNLKDEFATAPASTTFTESKNSALGWNLGYAMGGSKEKGMGLVGLMLSGLSQSRDEANVVTYSAVNKTDISNLHLLVSTAGEAKLNSWLSFRAGLSSDLFYTTSTVTETGASGSTTKTTNSRDAHLGTAADPNATATMGLSVNIGDITIDGVLNQGLLYSGTYLISGIPEAVSSQVSLTWPWGGSKQ